MEKPRISLNDLSFFRCAPSSKNCYEQANFPLLKGVKCFREKLCGYKFGAVLMQIGSANLPEFLGCA
jgi:hypothetical protein